MNQSVLHAVLQPREGFASHKCVRARVNVTPSLLSLLSVCVSVWLSQSTLLVLLILSQKRQL